MDLQKFTEAAMGTKKDNKNLVSAISSFIKDYLPVVKRRSEHTIDAYRQALLLFTGWMKDKKDTGFAELTADHFSEENICAFMEWLSTERRNLPSVVNQRLSHLKGFCRYLAKKDIMDYAGLSSVLDISPMKDTEEDEFIWLSLEETKAVLDSFDTTKRFGCRDHFLVALMYEAGCRCEEVVTLRHGDLRTNGDGTADLHIFGKGSKHRVVPISREIVDYYCRYCKIFPPDTKQELGGLIFPITRKGTQLPMSEDNVQRILEKTEKKTKEKLPDLPHLHAHLFRRTRAMHLLTHGMSLPLVSEWLGHSQLETTQIYARATMEMKREAKEKADKAMGPLLGVVEKFKYADDEETLKKLAGLI